MTTWTDDEAGGSSNAPQASITGGAIDGTPIGATTAASGRFTTLVSTGAATLASASITGALSAGSFSSASSTLTGGTINSMAIGGSTPAAGAFTTLTASGRITVAAGSALAPAYSDSTLGTKGIYFTATHVTNFSANSTYIADINTGGIAINGGLNLVWRSAGEGTTADLAITRDAANTLAQRNSTSAQTSNIYSTFTSTSNYSRLGLKSSKTTLSSVSGASVTATNLIPDGAFYIGVTTRVNVSLGTGGGTTGYQVGDGSDADRWGAITGTAAGTDSDNTDATAAANGFATAAANVVITAVGGNFNGTGDIEVCVHYLIAEAD